MSARTIAGVCRAAAGRLALLGALLAALSPLACSSFLLPDDPGDSPKEIFDILWDDFDRHYSLFEVKGTNWDSLRAVWRPRISDDLTDEALFDTLGAFLTELRDGHVLIARGSRTIQYQGWYEDYPPNHSLRVVQERYLPGAYVISPEKALMSGLIAPGVGYVYVPSFAGSGWVADMDGVIESLRGAGATSMIVDVRSNSGGDDGNSVTLAGRFADRRRPYRDIRYRNGPKHSDFTDPIINYVSPEGPSQFTGPIVVLTNRRVFSSAESFVLAMRQFPYVTTVGDTTGGGSANAVSRELPNGWSYRVPSWVERTLDGEVFDGAGLRPDVPVWITQEDSLARRDTILDTAISRLTGSARPR